MGFCVLKPDGGLFGTRWAYGEIVEPSATGPADRCPVCGAPVGRLRWLPPHRLKLSSSRSEKWGDLVWGAGFTLVVSARFKAIYEAENMEGISRFYPPATIVRAGSKTIDSLSKRPPVYHLVEITWNGANLDDQASGAIRKRSSCGFHRGSVRSVERVMLEVDSWTGADIFGARGLSGVVLVSERFRQVVDTYQVTGGLLIPAERYAYDETRPGLWYVQES